MMFKIKWTDEAQATYAQLKVDAEASLAARQKKGKKRSSKAEGLFKQVHKAIQQLGANPKHPGLKTHEYKSLVHPYDANGKVFEAYAQNDTPGAYRIFWCYGPEKSEMTIIAITPHP
ncbi:MAG: hypothetical protein HY000_01395 [Planctomycetes bacterium]|nr:hypothetical protein [Planctomycetota bacterium]